MPLPDFDSAVGHSFGLEVDSIIIRQITEVSGLKMEQDVIEYKSEHRRRQVRRTQGCPARRRPARSP